MPSSLDIASLLYETSSPPRKWLMSHAERAAILHILRLAQPASAIEIGTDAGGCLDQIRRHASTSYSIDISPQVRESLAADMPDVEFLTGGSAPLIGTALERCAAKNQPLGFVLIDGDHTYRGVQADIHALLQHRPTRDVWVLMHDSFNPECRRGIAEAHWADNAHVHLVELDFINGTLSQDPEFEGQIWGGLALALLRAEPRAGLLEIAASSALNYQTMYAASGHPPTLRNRWRHWLRIKKKGLARRLAKLR